MDWKIGKYRISGDTITIIGTDYRSTKKLAKIRQNRRYIGEISMENKKIGEWRHARRRRRRTGKNRRFFEAPMLLIWWPILNFWGSDGPDFTRVFVKASNGQICDPMMENQSSLYPRAMECFQRLYEDLMVKFEPNFDPTVKINL